MAMAQYALASSFPNQRDNVSICVDGCCPAQTRFAARHADSDRGYNECSMVGPVPAAQIHDTVYSVALYEHKYTHTCWRDQC